MPNVIERAEAFAKEVHGSQVRKWTKAPYWTHLQEVAQLCQDHGMPIPVVAAAWLHDTIEDTEVTFAGLQKNFDTEIAYLVLAVSDVSKPEDGLREVRKAIDRQYLTGASGYAKSIKLADMISNTADVVEHDRKFAEIYLAEKELLLPCLMLGRDSLWNLAWKRLRDATQRLAETEPHANPV